MNELVASLLLWVLTQCPQYQTSDRPTLMLTPSTKKELTGSYQDGTGLILITDVPGAESSNVRFQALVVHELTHWLQDQSGMYGNDTTCQTWQLREREAFNLQRSYLMQHGKRPGPMPALLCYP